MAGITCTCNTHYYKLKLIQFQRSVNTETATTANHPNQTRTMKWASVSKRCIIIQNRFNKCIEVSSFIAIDFNSVDCFALNQLV